MLSQGKRSAFLLAIWLIVLSLTGAAVSRADTLVPGGSRPTDVTTLALDPQAPATLYAGTGSGQVWRSGDGGAHWQVSGVLPGGVRVGLLVVDPAAAQVLYAASGPDVFTSSDAGAAWSPAGAGLSQEPHSYNYISALAASPVMPGTLWAGMRYSGGGYTFKSTDSAAHWVPAGNVIAFDFAFDPTAPDTVYAAGLDLGVQKTTDGGAHWTGLKWLQFNIQVLVNPQVPATVYTVDAGSAVYKSTNGGATWDLANVGLWTAAPNCGHCLAIDPQAPQTLYAAVGPGIFRTTDGAANWERVNRELRGASQLVTDPTTPGLLYALWNGEVYKSADGGVTWGPSWGAAWHVETAQADPDFRDLDPRGLRVDGAGRVHLVYDGGLRPTAQYGLRDSAGWSWQALSGDRWRPTLALDPAGRPQITSHDGDMHVLYSYWTGSTWLDGPSIQNVMQGGRDVPADTALEIGADGKVRLSYGSYDRTREPWWNGEYTELGSAGWNSPTTLKIYAGSGALALDSANRPHLIYGGDAGTQHFFQTGSGWSSEQVMQTAGRQPSLAIGPGNSLHVSYHTEHDLAYATRQGGSWLTETIASGAVITLTDISPTSIAVDPLGRPAVSFYDAAAKAIMVAVRPAGAPVGSAHWDVYRMAQAGQVPYSALTISPTGVAYVAFYDENEVKVASASLLPRRWLPVVQH